MIEVIFVLFAVVGFICTGFCICAVVIGTIAFITTAKYEKEKCAERRNRR